MDCPKCVGKLQQGKVGEETIDVCFLCEGVWFEHGELDRVIRADAKNFVSEGLDSRELDGREASGIAKELDHKRGKCPKCGAVMAASEYKKDVLIDVCGAGHGIWLDGGEIKKLRERTLADLIERFKFAFSAEGWKTFLGKAGFGRRGKPSGPS
jgi:uncharacterized protein